MGWVFKETDRIGVHGRTVGLVSIDEFKKRFGIDPIGKELNEVVDLLGVPGCDVAVSAEQKYADKSDVVYFKPKPGDDGLWKAGIKGRPVLVKFDGDGPAQILCEDGTRLEKPEIRRVDANLSVRAGCWNRITKEQAIEIEAESIGLIPDAFSERPIISCPPSLTAYWTTGQDPKSEHEKPTADQLEKAAQFFAEIAKSRPKKKSADQSNVLAVQHGGNHYKGMKIQPVEYAKANDLDCLQFSVVKYITRHRLKAGAEDLKKCIHFAQMALKMDYGVDSKVEYSEEKKAGN